MEVRFLTSDDYETLSSWWKDWRWTAPPKDMLPENGLGGVMVHMTVKKFVQDLCTSQTHQQHGLSL